MRFVFADDSRQRTPFRDGMGALVAIGGVCVPAENVRPLESAIGTCCQEAGFPKGDEFKWSPERGSWMHEKLKADARSDFFRAVLSRAKKYGCKVFVVIEDETSKKANADAADHEEDAIRLFVERIGRELDARREDGVIVVDRPGGDRSDEDRMLEDYLELLEAGTKWVKPTRVALNVLSSPSHCIRLLQLADLVTGCTLAAVSGEQRYAPPIFALIKEMLGKDHSRIGGIGLKIHPHYKYANLYHWIVGDSHFWKMNMGAPLPMSGRPYSQDAAVAWPKLIVKGEPFSF